MTLPRRVSKPGPILEYLNGLLAAGPQTEKRAKEAIAAVRAVLSTKDGAILLDLLEKSTTDFFLDPLASERACDALNAQRFIALDLRRIVSDELEHVLEQNRARSAERSGRRRPGPAG